MITSEGKAFIKATLINILYCLYSTAKQHKNPVKFRYITSTRNRSLKPLAVILKHCFKSVQREIVKRCRYFDAKFKYTIKSCFISDNNVKVREDIYRLNTYFGSIDNVTSFDFETLYTALPHDLIKPVLASMINDIFQYVNKKFIRVTPKKAYFSDSDRKYKGHTIFTKEDVLKLLRFLINNSYVSFKGKIYKQWVGIPMGIDPAPYMANLFLHYFENKYIKLLVDDKDEKGNKKDSGKAKEDMIFAQMLRYCYRYLDDLLNINDNGYFEKIYNSIYPNELKLNRTNPSDISTEFLDMDISIVDHKIITSKLFDKRRSFPFKVINFPFIESSNIPTMPSYNIYLSQILRIVRICNNIGDFIVEVESLTKEFLLKGFNKPLLSNIFYKFVKNYCQEWGKFGVEPRLPECLI